MYRIFAAALVFITGMSLASAENANGLDKSVDEIRACSRANLPKNSLAQQMLLQPVDRQGGSRDIRSIFLIKSSENAETRATLQVRAPIDLSGVSYLWVDKETDDQVFFYLPSLQRVRRVTGKTAAASMLGSDFSYEDVKHLRSISAGGMVKKLTDTQAQGRSVHRLQITPAPGDESVYDRLIFHVDMQTCVPLIVEFFESGDTPRKRMTADPDSLKSIGKRWIATRLTMRDLVENTHTLMEIEKVEFDEHINDAVFSRRGFYLGAYLE